MTGAVFTYSERVEKAAASLHHAKTLLSATDIQTLCQQALVSNSVLSAVQQACEAARDNNYAISPEGLLAFITDNVNPHSEPKHEAPDAQVQAQV